VGPYLSHAIEYAFALDDGCGEGVGYTLGVLDTTEFLRTSEGYRNSLAAKYPYRAVCDGCIVDSNPGGLLLHEQELVNKEMHSTVDLTQPHKYHNTYPSHLHIDIKKRYQGKGYGVVLINRQLGALRAGGSKGVHLIQAADNGRALHFYTTKFGFEIIDRLPGELVLGLKL